MRVFSVALIVSLACTALAGTSAHASTSQSDKDFNTCPEAGPVPSYPAAPAAPDGPYLPAGSEVAVPTSQINAGAYQAAQVQVGSQVFETILDTGSSWMVINSGAIEGNTGIEITDETAAVSYAGGAACTVGRVARGPVSIGGLAPREVTFLIAETGNVPFYSIIGMNTWDPVSSKLDIPLDALGIDTFEFTLPMSTSSDNPGLLVLNGQPTIDSANPRRVASFDNPVLAGGNRIYVPGAALAGRSSTTGAFMLDSGTPFNNLVFFPSAAIELGYDYVTSTWSTPTATPSISAWPSKGLPAMLTPSVASVTLDEATVITPEQTTTPEDGILGLAGTDAVIGADYLRPWVLGVHFTDGGSEIRLLARERRPALRDNCAGIAPARIKERGRTLLVPRECRVNGERVSVSVQGVSARGDADGFRLVRRQGATWIVTDDNFRGVTLRWRAPAYLSHNSLRIERNYRG